MEDLDPRSPVSRRRRISYSWSAQGPDMDVMKSTVHLLDYNLSVVSVPKAHLASATHGLLQILLKLFNTEGRRGHFFSFTETALDYSIILDAQLLQELNPPSSAIKLAISTDKWRPLVVEVGALGSLTGISKLAASVIGPLADKCVSVFCLSTSTEDYVMVKEVDLKKALACLSKRFKLSCDSHRQSDIALIRSIGQASCESPMRLAPPPSYDLHGRPITHPYDCASIYYSICGVVPSTLPSIGTVLLECMLFNKSNTTQPFFSFSAIEEDISIVINCVDIKRFPADSLYLSDQTWRMIRIGEGPLGFDECGIVAQVSAPLALAEISTFYICTFCTDHTLVPQSSVDKTLLLLNERYNCHIPESKDRGTECSKTHMSDYLCSGEDVEAISSLTSGTHTFNPQ